MATGSPWLEPEIKYICDKILEGVHVPDQLTQQMWDQLARQHAGLFQIPKIEFNDLDDVMGRPFDREALYDEANRRISIKQNPNALEEVIRTWIIREMERPHGVCEELAKVTGYGWQANVGSISRLREWDILLGVDEEDTMIYDVKPDIEVVPRGDDGQHDVLPGDALMYVEIGVNKDTALLFDNARQFMRHTDTIPDYHHKARLWMVVDVKEHRPTKERSVPGLQSSWGLSHRDIQPMRDVDLVSHIRRWYDDHNVEITGTFQIWIYLFREARQGQPELLVNASFCRDDPTETHALEIHYQHPGATVRMAELLPLVKLEDDRDFILPFDELAPWMLRGLVQLTADRLLDMASWKKSGE